MLKILHIIGWATDRERKELKNKTKEELRPIVEDIIAKIVIYAKFEMRQALAGHKPRNNCNRGIS